ncbi:MAG: hypothetical protein LBL46_01740 [Rickettsiales bacterium]|jgi:hypothetical protein|nr:hypothetical protein [Rickettsiales bacterium]
MNYPQRFFTKMFASERSLELARRFAVWSGALLLLISIAAGAVWWARRSQSARPYFMFIDAGGDWRVLAAKTKSDVPWTELFQESLARRIAADWFLITGDMAENNAVLWGKCETCDGGSWDKCRIQCAAATGVFDDFSRSVVPKWRKVFGDAATQKLTDISVEKVDAGRAGVWKIGGVVRRTNTAPRSIVGFMRIERGRGRPETLGFYVAGFEWYGE